FPAVNWISPALSGGAEIIRRHAGYYGRLPVVRQVKVLGIGPHVSAVESHVNGNVADHANSCRVRVASQLLPLAEEFKLPVLHRQHLVLQALTRGFDG